MTHDGRSDGRWDEPRPDSGHHGAGAAWGDRGIPPGTYHPRPQRDPDPHPDGDQADQGGSTGRKQRGGDPRAERAGGRGDPAGRSGSGSRPAGRGAERRGDGPAGQPGARPGTGRSAGAGGSAGRPAGAAGGQRPGGYRGW
ncbi:MAG TPA: hypothetical protein VMU51_20280, partial [Mycobacteriales bacterium]|nr:hypothetical protein [Mycobacteriales bacterium]